MSSLLNPSSFAYVTKLICLAGGGGRELGVGKGEIRVGAGGGGEG